MPFLEDLMGLGMPDQLAGIVSNDTVTSAPTRSVSTGLTAAGSAIGDALQLTSFVNVVSTAAASTGVKLSANWPVGQIGFVQNNGANALNLFPPSASVAINGGTLGAAVTIAAAAGNIIVRLSATDFGAYTVAKEA
jgi:hypothetical protein